MTGRVLTWTRTTKWTEETEGRDEGVSTKDPVEGIDDGRRSRNGVLDEIPLG